MLMLKIFNYAFLLGNIDSLNLKEVKSIRNGEILIIYKKVQGFKASKSSDKKETKININFKFF